jgi:hypothetical protein
MRIEMHLKGTGASSFLDNRVECFIEVHLGFDQSRNRYAFTFHIYSFLIAAVNTSATIRLESLPILALNESGAAGPNLSVMIISRNIFDFLVLFIKEPDSDNDFGVNFGITLSGEHQTKDD